MQSEVIQSMGCSSVSRGYTIIW